MEGLDYQLYSPLEEMSNRQGYPTTDAAFSSQFHVVSKLVIVALMVSFATRSWGNIRCVDDIVGCRMRWIELSCCLQRRDCLKRILRRDGSPLLQVLPFCPLDVDFCSAKTSHGAGVELTSVYCGCARGDGCKWVYGKSKYRL